MFGCKYEYIWSIGFATRNDIPWPADMSKFGSTEAERRFNCLVSKYSKLQSVMSLFTLLPDYHGAGTTWFIRKQLTYQSPIVSGPGWVTIGDGIGFTNPLLSPGINTGIASDTLAADLTKAAISVKDEDERVRVWQKYDNYCANALPSLEMMNKFLYLSFLHPSLAPRVALMWQITIGHALPGWSLPRRGFQVSVEEYADYAIHWLWGSQVDDYVKVATKAIEMLGSLPVDKPVPQDIVDELIAFSEATKEEALGKGRYMGFPFRYAGEFRFYGPRLEYDEEKYELQDIFANQCSKCTTWHTLRGDWRKCYTCGVERPKEDCEITWRPALNEYELSLLIKLAPNPLSIGTCAVEFLETPKLKKMRLA